MDPFTLVILAGLGLVAFTAHKARAAAVIIAPPAPPPPPPEPDASDKLFAVVSTIPVVGDLFTSIVGPFAAAADAFVAKKQAGFDLRLALRELGEDMLATGDFDDQLHADIRNPLTANISLLHVFDDTVAAMQRQYQGPDLPFPPQIQLITGVEPRLEPSTLVTIWNEAARRYTRFTREKFIRFYVSKGGVAHAVPNADYTISVRNSAIISFGIPYSATLEPAFLGSFGLGFDLTLDNLVRDSLTRTDNVENIVGSLLVLGFSRDAILAAIDRAQADIAFVPEPI